MSRAGIALFSAALILLLVAACVTGGGDGAVPAKDPRVVTMDRVVMAGYSVIATRYVDPIEPKTITLFALRGLRTLEPKLEIDVTPDDKLTLTLGGKQIGVWPLPAADNARAWARMTAQAVNAAYENSAILQAYTQDQVLKAVMDGALQPLDRHSRYSDPAAASDARFSREGAGGIGITIRTVDKKVVIESVFPDMPAAMAGFRMGDRIVGINGQSVVEWDQRRVVQHLRGDVDTKVTLTVEREGEPEFTASVVRALIIPPTVSYERRGDVALIKLTGFNQATTLRLEVAVEQAQREIGPDLAGIVLDMRGNPGGLLDQAVSVADLFLDSGVVTSTRGRHPDSAHVYRAAGGAIAPRVPLVILINGRSASAAEIVAAALQDRGRAVVIGSNSYGKGTVQTVVRLPNDGELTLTWSRLHGPSGYSWHEIGVMPTVCTQDVAADGDDLSQQFSERSKRMAEMIALWHSSRRPPIDKLEKLRQTCRPSDAATEKDDLIAVRLLHDPTLYHRAIGVTLSAMAQR